MPELPEVETIRRQLQSRIAGKTIKSVKVLYPKVMQGKSPADFVRALSGKKVCEVGRQGKLILIRLSGDETLVVHLKMTGRLLLQPSSHPERRPKAGVEGSHTTKSTEVIFTFTPLEASRRRRLPRLRRGPLTGFTNGTILRYDDLRRFGYMKIVPTSEEARVVQKERLGIDFFDRALTVERFKELIRSRAGSQIKPLLLDQSLIAGIGNIYAQEACFMARIHPLRKAGDLRDKELSALYQALRAVMLRAIKYGGTSADDYRDAFGQMGKFAAHLKVYSREGKPCLRCKTKLVKKSIGGRGTVFCPKCQA